MTLIERIRAGLQRDRELPLGALARKGAQFAWSLATARAYFARCTRVGRSPRARGRPYIDNLGELLIGDDFNLSSQFVTSHLVTGPKGRLVIGDDVTINYGAGLCAHKEIRIGNRVRIGPYAMILDTDFHSTGNHDEAAEAQPIVIEDDVWLAGRVTVLRGTHIGAGSVITAGSVVSGTIPPGVIAGGNPARVLRKTAADEAQGNGAHPEGARAEVGPGGSGAPTLRPLTGIDSTLVGEVGRVFAEVFHLSEVPPPSAGSRQIRGWDSMGHLTLLSALEARFGVSFDDEGAVTLDTVGACIQWVDAHRGSASGADTEKMQWPGTLHEALILSAERRPEQEAVCCDERVLSYASLVSRTASLSTALAAAGVVRGQPVLLAVDDKLEFIAAYYAVVSLGAIAVPLSEAAVIATALDTAERCGATRLVCDTSALERLGASRLRPLSVVEVGQVATEVVELGAATARLRRSDIQSGDIAAYAFTSGTTARKAVVLTHRNLMQAAENIATYLAMTAAIREYVTVPLAHSFGWGRVRTVLSVGGTLVLNNGPLRAGRVLQSVEARQCNALSAVPAGIAVLHAAGEGVMGRLGQRLRLVELGSAVMSADQKRRLASSWPRTRICMHYGLTEASRSTFLDFRADAAHLDTVGRAAPNVQVSVCDATGRPLDVGKEGEIVVRGPHVVTGYLNDPERTARAFRDDGAMRTGDVGSLDANGYLRFGGRLDEQINHGGMNVSPLEVEEALRGVLPGVDYCVIGLPDPRGIVGDVVTLVCAPGTPPPTVEQVATAMADVLEGYKLPRQVMVASLPRTSNGKLQRSKLRTALLARPS